VLNEIYGITIEQIRDIERRVSQHIIDRRSQLYTQEQIIDAIENCLDTKEQQVIVKRFGLEDGITRSLSEIELRFGLSREQVRKLEKIVLDYVRSHS